MQFLFRSTTGVAITAVLAAVLCQGAPGQSTPGKAAPTGKEAPVSDATRIFPRATPAEYQAHAQAGAVTVAAEFTSHSVATLQATLSTDDFVMVEVGLFGPPDAHLKLSHEDFSLRINGKTPLVAQSYVLTYTSLKDPEWAPPQPKSKEQAEPGEPGSDRNPRPVHVPFELVRVMEQRVQKAALPEGDRALPEAGLIFFKYGGRSNGIHSVELLYDGPAGKATLTFQL